jgi:hypothetical protein
MAPKLPKTTNPNVVVTDTVTHLYHIIHAIVSEAKRAGVDADNEEAVWAWARLNWEGAANYVQRKAAALENYLGTKGPMA